MKYSDFTTAREIGSKVIAQFKPKFYVNNVKNKPGHENEMSLQSKVNVWLMSVAGATPFRKEIYGSMFRAYPQSVLNLCFGEYRNLFKEFIDTSCTILSIPTFRARFKEWSKGNKSTELVSCPQTETPEPDKMEQASKELLNNDGVYGYVDENLKTKIKKIINKTVENYLH